MKIKISKIERNVVIVETIFIIGVFVYLFFSTSPSAIYPLQGMSISEPDFNIEIENGEQVWISTNTNFTNPIILEENSEVTLPPGIYYWKVKGRFRESEVQSFEIKSQVGLDILERPENYEIQNSGNVDLEVKRDNKGFTSSMTLDAGEFEEVEKDDSKYEGVQK